jgi:tyrosine decarboxylase / aspartate 1-decarboxylase
MCTQPHPIAQKAYKMFLASNLGDPGLFPGTAQLEKDVINDLTTLLHGKNCRGFVVSGGTEANLLALLSARNLTQKEQPEVILPDSAHFSFTKICNLLKLKPIYAPLDSKFAVNAPSIEGLVSKNTVAIVGTAGTAELGVVDPISQLAKIAKDHDVHLHVDAAFGGLIIPFIDGDKPIFDFCIEEVASMTVDPHKMGMSTIPAGGIIFRDEDAIEAIKTQTPYLSDSCQYTFVGTRSGASVASAWAVLHYLGVEGFRKTIAKCMKNTRFLADRLKTAGFQLVIEPTLNIVAFRKEEGTKSLAEKLWRHGWFVSYIPRYDCIRMVLMPHVTKANAEAFLKQLKIEKL